MFYADPYIDRKGHDNLSSVEMIHTHIISSITRRKRQVLFKSLSIQYLQRKKKKKNLVLKCHVSVPYAYFYHLFFIFWCIYNLEKGSFWCLDKNIQRAITTVYFPKTRTTHCCFCLHCCFQSPTVSTWSVNCLYILEFFHLCPLMWMINASFAHDN